MNLNGLETVGNAKKTCLFMKKKNQGGNILC